MQTTGKMTLALLHDLALLYLGLAHGADGNLDPAETSEIAGKLRLWMPDKDPALIDHVIREAALTYLNADSTERMNAAIGALEKQLPESLRLSILQDMTDIARADGSVEMGERHFIRRVAEVWKMETNA